MKERLIRWLRYLLALCSHYSGMDMIYRRASGTGLVVLMLHRLREEHDPYPLSISKRSLSLMVDWLRRAQRLTALDAGLQNLAQTPIGDVKYAITFDDGYHDNLRLADADMGEIPAVVYVVTNNIGGDPIWVYRLMQAVEWRTHDHLDLGMLGLGHFNLADPGERERLYTLLPPRLKQFRPETLEACIDALFEQTRPTAVSNDRREMLDWNDVRALDAHGVEIGAHTCNHVLLSRVDDATAEEEILRCSERIASELGAPPRHFAYPNGGYGDFSERDVALAREAGFATAVTSIEGVNRRGVDPYRLLRHNVHEERFRAPTGHLSKALFFSETSGVLGWLRTRRAA